MSAAATESAPAKPAHAPTPAPSATEQVAARLEAQMALVAEAAHVLLAEIESERPKKDGTTVVVLKTVALKDLRAAMREWTRLSAAVVAAAARGMK